MTVVTRNDAVGSACWGVTSVWRHMGMQLLSQWWQKWLLAVHCQPRIQHISTLSWYGHDMHASGSLCGMMRRCHMALSGPKFVFLYIFTGAITSAYNLYWLHVIYENRLSRQEKDNGTVNYLFWGCLGKNHISVAPTSLVWFSWTSLSHLSSQGTQN